MHWIKKEESLLRIRNLGTSKINLVLRNSSQNMVSKNRIKYLCNLKLEYGQF
jgi:hypothetical protein